MIPSNKTNKALIDSAFGQSFKRVCYNHHISLHHVSIVIQIKDTTNLEIHLCRKDVSVIKIDCTELLCGKLIGLRINVAYLEKILRTVHYAFMKDLDKQPSSINLVLYESIVAKSFCIGVVVDKKPVKVLVLSDILKAMEHHFVLLN